MTSTNIGFAKTSNLLNKMICSILFAAISTSALIHLLIWLIVLAIVAWALFYFVGLLPIPQPIKTLITLVVVLILLLVILNQLSFI